MRISDWSSDVCSSDLGRSLTSELQHNLIVTHAVCTGEPFAADVVRAMLAIRINTLMRGHSGVRPSTLQALADLLNAGVVPVVPKLGSVGASGDLAPLSHLAIVLLGERSEEHTSELQSLMRNSYAVFCLKKK